MSSRIYAIVLSGAQPLARRVPSFAQAYASGCVDNNYYGKPNSGWLALAGLMGSQPEISQGDIISSGRAIARVVRTWAAYKSCKGGHSF
jgi:hypothetical protein